ncbi:hypothetical protein EXS70_03985 [Candidatus Peribacteria bacterium]|nr:hypothetical protein [Candidatus Peribacteria bacterium]
MLRKLSMTPSPSPQDQRRKEDLQRFNEQSLKGAQEIEKKTKRAAADFKKSRQEFEAQGKVGVEKEAKQAELQKKQAQQWRTEEVKKKTEITQDKKWKVEAQALMKEKREKKLAYEDKQHAYFESMREATAKKALADRRKHEKDQELKAEVLRIDREGLQEKQKADSEELRAKNDIEREGLRTRDAITREFRDLEQKLFSEESRQKTTFQGMGAAGKSHLDLLAKEMTKKRADLHTQEQARQRQREQDTLKKRGQAEARTRNRKAEIEREMASKKSQIAKERQALGL